MPTQIDHVLIANRVLEETVADYGRLGFTVVPGGTHASGRTRNALVTFQDGTYLELIAPSDPDAPLDEAESLRLAGGEGLIQFALASDDVAREAEQLTRQGLAVSAVAGNGRLRPDGRRTDWQTIGVAAPEDVALPFVISDLTPRNVRVPDGEHAVHHNGVTGILGLTSVVGNLAATVDHYRRLFSDPGTPVESDAEGAGAAIRFAVGAHWLELVEPAAGENALRTYLEAKGPRPLEVILASDGNGAARGELLDTTLSHGARLRVVG